MPGGGTADSAAAYVPQHPTLDALRAAASRCQGCDLHARATQTVFGEGPLDARVMVVGEQPGDQEDQAGHPFVGPAGRLLDQALQQAGVDRDQVYVTNAVKHFKWEPRGKRRLHKRPSQGEVKACTPWLENELGLVRPDVLVCLGVTAASAAFGKLVRLRDLRGHFSRSRLADQTLVTIHPSALLRLKDTGVRELEFARLVEDLARVRERLH